MIRIRESDGQVEIQDGEDWINAKQAADNLNALRNEVRHTRFEKDRVLETLAAMTRSRDYYRSEFENLRLKTARKTPEMTLRLNLDTSAFVASLDEATCAVRERVSTVLERSLRDGSR